MTSSKRSKEDSNLVVVTGSSKGSYTAWRMVQLLLLRYGIKSTFLHPAIWDKNDTRIEKMRGLILLGGIDIDPSLYGQKMHEHISGIDTKRDQMELYLLSKAEERSLPVFGICRGMQMINLFYGGSLFPHIDDLSLQEEHKNNILPLKWIEIIEGTKLWHIIKEKRIKVNALHHQAIDELGEGIRKAAFDHNGIIQAIEHKERDFVMGVQWHPEYMPYRWHSRRLFFAFSQRVKVQYTK